MEPVTHALASIALGRARPDKITRAATPMLLVSGLIADLDWIAKLGGAETFLRWHRTATHSLIGTGVIVAAVAVSAWLVGRKSSKFAVRFLPALAICAIGAGVHLFLDLLNGYGVQLFWPFRAKWHAWDLLSEVDWWLLLFPLAGLLIPEFFRLMHQEIGAKPKRDGRQSGAIVGLVLCALWIGARTLAHERAMTLLDSREYHGQTPLEVAAFPGSANPLLWSGVVETDNMVLNVDLNLGPGRVFDPDAADAHFKPEASTTLKNALASPAAIEFLRFARFPLASVQPEGDGFVVRLRDMRFAQELRGSPVVAVIHVNAEGAVVDDQIEFDSDGKK